MVMSKRVNLDALEAEIESWRGEVPLSLDVVTSLIAELRYWRERAAAEAEGVADHPPEQCGIARERTGGTYYCSREPGHDGPCAAWLTPPGQPSKGSV